MQGKYNNRPENLQEEAIRFHTRDIASASSSSSSSLLGRPQLKRASSSGSRSGGSSSTCPSSYLLSSSPGLRRANSFQRGGGAGTTGFYSSDEDGSVDLSGGGSNRSSRSGSFSDLHHHQLPRSPSGSILASTSFSRLPSNNSFMLARYSSRSVSSARRWHSLLNTKLWREKEFGLQVSPQDERQYRLIRLPNNLKAIIVSDPTSEKAAAALSVKMGASSDPREASGLAHFLEHMLFLGTSKYPRENTYKDLVNRNGGGSNASTSMDMTVYKFDVAAECFPSVLDVFSQFFIAPLFTESATEREMKAVDAENSKNLVNDGRRLLQIMKAVGDPSHPWTKFSTGNLSTLRDDLPSGFDIRTALIDFYDEHYYASKMALAIVGRESLDTLEILVHEKFSAIIDKPPPPPAFTTELSDQPLSIDGDFSSPAPPLSSPPPPIFRNPFPPKSAGGGAAVPIIRIVPLRDKREMQLTWPMPSIRTLYRSPPTRLLSHLLGHEGEGSIFSVLHGQGWASGVNAGVGTTQDDFCLFEVTVQLTEEGQKHWHDVAGLIFHYIQLISQAPPEDLSQMWDETRAISATTFRFQQKSSEYSYAADLARRRQLYDSNHVLSGGYLYDDLDFPTFSAFLQRLTEENIHIFLSFKDHGGAPLDQKEPWYPGVFYGIEYVPAHQARQWTCSSVESLHLPRPNPFVPEDFEILGTKFEPPSATATPPEKAVSTPVLELWHKTDNSFKQPRAHIILDFSTPLVQRDPASADLLVRYIDHALAESTYDALTAGLSWSINTTHHGLSLRFSGFSHKLQTLMHKVMESLLSLNIHGGLFNLSKEKAVDAYRNVKMARPDEHCSMYLNLLLTEGRWDWRDKLERVQTLDLHDLASYHRQLLSTSTVKVGVFGNVSQESAIGIAEQVERLLRRNPKFSSLTPSHQPVTRVAMLDKGIEYRLRTKVPNEEDINSAVYIYFQSGLLNPSEYSRLALLAQILKEPTFTQLRTREQLGYIVASGLQINWFKSMVGGVAFRLLSKTHNPEDMMKRVEAFLPQFRDNHLKTMAAEEFARHKASLITNFLEPPKKLVSECSLHWSEITNETKEWQRNRLHADAIEAAQLEEIVELFDRLVVNKESRRKLSVLVHGNAHPMEEQAVLPSNEDGVIYLTEKEWLSFRQARPLFPCSASPMAKY